MAPRVPGRKQAPARDKAPDEKFGQVLRRVRTERKITQEQLAWATGIERAFISELERGVKGASVNMLFRLSHGLGVAPSELIAETERLVQIHNT